MRIGGLRRCWREPRRLLEVLGARMSNTAASLAEIAATMSPPMTKEALAAQVRRARAAEVCRSPEPIANQKSKGEGDDRRPPMKTGNHT
ncbi:hypothetical protein CKJ70_26075 [Mycobacterium avium]|nr:helix-turn-helix domain-containing protein [Mycobacterium avium]PBA08479.1 hypothetical protein CKJ70_26075 [Mycobacterium avium]